MNFASSLRSVSDACDMKTSHIGQDGIILAISDKLEAHPIYQTDAFPMRAVMPVNALEGSVYDEIYAQKIGDLRISLRSTLAQLGIEAFHPADTSFKKRRGALVEVETHITSLNGDAGYTLIEMLREYAENTSLPQPTAGRLCLRPDAAHLNRTEIAQLQESDDLRIAEDASLLSNGGVSLPSVSEYVFRETAWERAAIQNVLTGSGRSELANHRESPRELPSFVVPGGFLVSHVDVSTKTHHVFLRNETYSPEGNSPFLHGSSIALDAGRTCSATATRQLELYNMAHSPQSPRGVYAIADVYRAHTVLPVHC